MGDKKTVKALASLIEATCERIKTNFHNPDILFTTETVEEKIHYIQTLLDFCIEKELWEQAAILRDVKRVYEEKR